MMKHLMISTLATLLSVGTWATVASAEQVHPGHLAADINGDGEVSLTELKQYNRDQRQS